MFYIYHVVILQYIDNLSLNIIMDMHIMINKFSHLTFIKCDAKKELKAKRDSAEIRVKMGHNLVFISMNDIFSE
ncbi:hypothetical protein CN491_26370 [Bacillus cereus]|uniref:Uncharacterized protein n=1 Tax=Bacillus cereus TaxID=1396 RepID=A0A2A8LGD1_BACCE|nr:hypothetical protein CN491_26370 [Bacillus cereus]